MRITMKNKMITGLSVCCDDMSASLFGFETSIKIMNIEALEITMAEAVIKYCPFCGEEINVHKD